MQYPATLAINAPPEKVFEFLRDPDKLKLWLDGLEATEYEPGYNPENPLGTKFKQRIRERGKVKEYDGVVTAYDRPRHLGVLLTVKDFRVQVDYRLSPAGPGTHLDYVADVNCSNWFLRLIMRLFGRFMTGVLHRQLAKLKKLAEEGA